MKNVIAQEVKVEIAALFVNNNELKVKEVAERFGVSERSVRRFKADFVQEAIEMLQKKVEAKKAAEQEKKEEKKVSKRGGKGRNGRWEIIWGVVADMTLEAKSKDLLAEINKRSVEAGLNELSRNAGYAMLSAARKSVAK